jgi:thiamine biosynthesis lipoprotein
MPYFSTHMTLTAFKRPYSVAVVFALFALGLAPACHAQWYKEERAIMGTSIVAEVWSTDTARAHHGIDAVMAEMHRIDDLMSPFRTDSELALVNREAADHPVRISRELFDLIERSLHFSRLSHGAFDITFSSVGYMYDYREGIAPTDAEIKKALPGINYRHLVLNRKASTIRFARKGMRIDLGGIAKGYAVDNSIAILRKMGFAQALVTAGGDSRIMGDKHGKPWMTGIRDPRRKNQSAVVIPLSNTAISTSGDYERYFIRNGVRYHHIINPKTGKSVRGTRSATVIGPDATTTDALSTTLFVLGWKNAMKLLESLPDIDAVIIDNAGKLHYSSGLEPPPAG